MNAPTVPEDDPERLNPTSIGASLNNWHGEKLRLRLSSGLDVYGKADEVVTPDAQTVLINRGSGNEVVVVLSAIEAIEPVDVRT